MPAAPAASVPFVVFPRPADPAEAALRGLTALPDSGYREILRELAGAEAVSGVMSVGATAAMSLVSANPLGLAVIGPIMEKFGFYGWALIKELRHPIPGTTWRERLRTVVQGGSENLLRDIFFHDTTYSGLLWGALTATGGAWAAGLAPLAFVVALLIAPRAELLTGEVLLAAGKRVTQRRGFRSVEYAESRSILGGRARPMEIFGALVERFGLSNHTFNRYVDTYYAHTIPDLSNRGFVVRTRTIQSPDGTDTLHHSFEVLFAHPRLRHREGVHPAFEIKKQKLWRDLDPARPMADQLGSVGSVLARRIDFAHPQTITFLRRCSYSDRLRVAIDMVPTGVDGEALYCLELKAYPEHQDVLVEALQHLHYLTGVYPSTRDKDGLAELFTAGADRLPEG